MTTVQSSIEVPQFREINNGELIVNWHPGQWKAWNSEARIINVQSGTQGGKTCMGPHWLDREMDSRGPGDYLAVTATFPLLRLKMLPELRYVFETLTGQFEWKAADKVFESHDKQHGAPAFRIIVGSATNAESLESATAKGAWLDEAGQHQFGRDAWEAIQRRVSLNRGRILITTTCYEWGWHKIEVFDRSQEDLEIETISFNSVDNPAFPIEEYNEQRAKLPYWKFNMQFRGMYERPAGVIYDAFDEACIIPRMPLPPDWPRYVGHDFGPNNTAAVWFAQDPATGFIYVYRTYHEGGLHTYEHAEKFKDLSRGEMIVKRVGGAHGEQEIRDAYNQAGWRILESKVRDVEAGIDIVYGFHKRNALFVFDDQKEYLDELMSYSRELDDAYQPTDKIADKSKYHLLDATRYLLSDFGPERAQNRAGIKMQTFRNKQKAHRRLSASGR